MVPSGSYIPLFLFFLSSSASTTLTGFVSIDCANQTFHDPLASENLNSLFKSLVSRSSTTNFYKTTSGENNQSISGFYQCHFDLSKINCSRCITELMHSIQKMCKTNTLAARVQLNGC
ncbi:unnamed protein product [Lactuca virosa]|uniref:Gnk2-homologous domain-containing protein n=1 Tax=Lactuca virosa TaxID=75947 RepID=A0AAU9MH64_9ASTR|nr:unnamed protein product [Lactuca virosa]